MEGLRGIIDHLQLRLAGDARHDMEALDHRSCSWLWFSNHRWPAPNQLLSEALHAISDQLLRPDRVSRASGIDAHTATALGGHTATGRTVTLRLVSGAGRSSTPIPTCIRRDRGRGGQS